MIELYAYVCIYTLRKVGVILAAVEFVKGVPADHDELLDFANYVFGTDFLKLVPKLYKPEYKSEVHHYLVKEDGRIKGAVGSFPMKLMINGEQLDVRGIGTVSVHPYSRRKGYMDKLMKWAMDDIRSSNADFACLGGMRQRYEYYSFEPCGPVFEYRLIPANIRHFFKDQRETGLTVSRVSQTDGEWLDRVRALHDAQPVHVARQGDFMDILTTWHNTPYVIHRNGMLAGYFTYEQKYSFISELVLDEGEAVGDAVKEIFNAFKPDSLIIKCAPWQKDQIGFLESMAEGCMMQNCESFTVMNYKKVIQALMKLKSGYTALADGELSICIDGLKRIRIAVSGGVPEVEECSGKCDIELPHLEAMRFLFSVQSAYYDYNIRISPELRSWFPLPLYFPRLDQV